MALEEREKKMLIGLGVVAGLFVAFLLFKMLTGGGDAASTDTAAGTTGTTTTTTGTATEAPPADASSSPAPAVYNDFVISARDPFSPIASPAGPASGSVSPSTSAGPVVSNEVTIDGHQIKLNAVIVRKTPLADTTVDGAAYRAGIGDTFAKYLTVKSLDTSTFCATFTYKSGGVTDEFNLCVE